MRKWNRFETRCRAGDIGTERDEFSQTHFIYALWSDYQTATCIVWQGVRSKKYMKKTRFKNVIGETSIYCNVVIIFDTYFYFHRNTITK